MRFRFNEKKSAQAAARLLRSHGGGMPYIALIKLLYLADRESLIQTGSPITGDRMVSMKYGPVLCEILDFIRGEDPSSPQPAVWFDYITVPSNHNVCLRPPDPELDELSPKELRVLDEIHRKYGGLDRSALVRYTRLLPEWRDPGASVLDIDPRDILRFAGWDEESIQSAARDAEAIDHFEHILARVR